ncbi:hypothetical protein BCR32DRAFT_329263 [Anaeromyces robustus]|uniref:Stealth protein CR2 conserved region 2 domain-containing protein n=1 Tax=Anaeromyces robustus TaxID=1754192 RepID=A0A1Y1WT81_9FUNG|nr:hypothetical protein BCR32DRAFT_329263 [Anaeromyces robustus]|eukprot:ORX76652.1 hypothetical protein BCR32DRAFT_329263 [Anaeromyces robustus]
MFIRRRRIKTIIIILAFIVFLSIFFFNSNGIKKSNTIVNSYINNQEILNSINNGKNITDDNIFEDINLDIQNEIDYIYEDLPINRTISASKLKKLLKDNEKNVDLKYILNYHGGDLEPEWEWARDISFVYTWVDGSEINFSDIKSKYNGGRREVSSRDRSADELRYSIRSLEKYLPWHRGTIFILTGQQVPEWLDTSNPRIKMVFHNDIFPEHVPPSYDASTIELFLDKIPGITERFVYFNDDFFANNYVHPCFFFTSKDFYPKVYRRYITKFNENKINQILEKNDMHEIFHVIKYSTYKLVKEYLYSNFKYRDLYHSGYVFYRDLFEPFRQLFEKELRPVCSDKFRNPFKPQVIYLYQAFMQYATQHKDFPNKLGGDGKAKKFPGYVLPSNRTIKKYGCEVQSPKVGDFFIKYGKITDNSRRNNGYFRLYNSNANLLMYNFNDLYTEDKSLFEFSKYMITRYPKPSPFEKKEYIELEKELLIKLKKIDKYSESVIENLPKFYDFKSSISKYNEIFENYKLGVIEKYLDDKKALSGHKNDTMSKREKNEIDFLLNYKGNSLEKEWQWAKSISIVYIYENDSNSNSNNKESQNMIKLNTIKYSLRSIERYLPWFDGTIYIVTEEKISDDDQLKIKHKNVKIVNQEDIIPETILSNENINKKLAIEMYLDKLPGISEKFIYLNNDSFFINYVHPRLFFGEDFTPKYNFGKPLTDNEIKKAKTNDLSFFSTYTLIKEYFGKNYIPTYRYLENAPIPLYRDLFDPVRKLYQEDINFNSKKNKPEILPMYLITNYNVYGTAQPYYPDFVTGYGKVKDAELPILNKDRTVKFYGFDITSSIIANDTLLLNISLSDAATTAAIDSNNNNNILKKINDSSKLFFSFEKDSKKILLNSNQINNLISLFNTLYNKKSSYED